ncbi:hypothetical protein GCM10007860_19890 [Chitiniphilus shinanonensis]|uniref:Protein mobE n=1 Tax=Chitiniphilus shinanonensis TaxID=553088 RepID=A0ABQ6BWF4_9NEIS|nr:hypothetical protein [Chitiniphilus shinanonensis]GLS04841.1 hypothetical protein GCM10007860_19890 [Chitiniphilus shinanonensis]
MTLAVAAAFEAAFQRKPPQEEVDRLARVMNVLDVRENDAIMVLMIVLEFYNGLYSSMPGRIEAAAKTVVRETKETTRQVAATAAQLAHSDLVEQFGKALNQVASDTARKQQWKALAIGIGAASISLLITGWMAFDQGKEAGYGAAIKVARNESAAATWANTPEGQLAYRLALVGSLQQVARCSAPGWKVKNGACLPYPDADGSLHGWALP